MPCHLATLQYFSIGVTFAKFAIRQILRRHPLPHIQLPPLQGFNVCDGGIMAYNRHNVNWWKLVLHVNVCMILQSTPKTCITFRYYAINPENMYYLHKIKSFFLGIDFLNFLIRIFDPTPRFNCKIPQKLTSLTSFHHFHARIIKVNHLIASHVIRCKLHVYN